MGGAGGACSAISGSATISGNMAFPVVATNAKQQSADPNAPRYEWTFEDTTLRCGDVDELSLPDGTYTRLGFAVFVTDTTMQPVGTFDIGNNVLPDGGSIDVQVWWEQDNVFTEGGQKQTDNGMLSGAGKLTIADIGAGPTITGMFTMTLGDGSMGPTTGGFVAKPCVACAP
jgi:hypothetical protein